MKKRQFFTIIAVIIIGFGIVIYQNNRIINYNRVLDIRQADIYKETVFYNLNDKIDRIEKDYLDETRGTIRALRWAFTNNLSINPEKCEE